MNRNKIAVLLIASAFSLSSYAGDNNNQNNSDIINNYTGDTNTYNTPTAYGGTGIGTGIGFGGAGGNGGAGGSSTVLSTNINAPSATGGSVKSDINNANLNLNSVKSKNDNTNVNDLTNKQGQDQGQLQGQGQKQGQQQGIEGSANNEGVTGNELTLNVAAPKTYRPPVNSAIAPTIFPTAPCMGSSSIGGTGTLFSFSGGTSWTSDECMILETARSFDQAGFTQDGLAVRCQGKWAKLAPSCQALNTKTEPVAVTKSATPVSKVEDKPALKLDRKLTVKQDIASPVTSSNGYYSVVTNPLAQ